MIKTVNIMKKECNKGSLKIFADYKKIASYVINDQNKANKYVQNASATLEEIKSEIQQASIRIIIEYSKRNPV